MPYAAIVPIITLAISAAATGVSVAASRQQTKSQEKAAKYNAKVAENNAAQARQQARFESEQIRRRNLKLLGKQRAAAAKSGVLIEGSVSDVIEESGAQAELDRLTVLYTGAMRSSAYKTEADLQRFGGKTAAKSGQWQTAGTLIGGLAQGGQYASSVDWPSFSNKSATKIEGP